MKTKEEVIRDAWKSNYDEFSEHIDSDGWARYPNFQKHEMVEDVRPIEFRSQRSDFRPQSLKGIETNNGWIRIKNQNELPKSLIGRTFVYTDKDNIYNYSQYVQWFSISETETITHYQVVDDLKPPLY